MGVHALASMALSAQEGARVLSSEHMLLGCCIKAQADLSSSACTIPPIGAHSCNCSNCNCNPPALLRRLASAQFSHHILHPLLHLATLLERILALQLAATVACLTQQTLHTTVQLLIQPAGEGQRGVE